MTIETWAKALTAMEAGFCATYSPVLDEWQVVPASRPETAASTLAKACEVLDLPWQQHPVWLMWEALQLMEQAVHSKWIGGAEGLAWAHGMKASPEDADLMRRAAEARKAALDAAKGGG